MVHLEGINVHLDVGGTALRAYKLPPEEERHIEPNTIAAYVEVAANCPFRIFVEIPSHSPPRLGDLFLFRIFFDGSFVGEYHHDAAGTFHGFLPPRNVEPLVFPHVVVDENESDEVADAEKWDEKEVLLQISHARMKQGSASAPGFVPTDDTIKPVGDADSVLAFTFRYRPYSILKSELRLHGRQQAAEKSPNDTAEETEPLGRHPADVALEKTMRVTGSGELYCYCMKIRRKQQVVSCDNDNCEIKSFHWDCVGLREEPEHEWFCPDCRDLSEEERVVGGFTEFFRQYGEPPCGCPV